MTEKIVDAAGHEWKTGCLPRTTKLGEINPATGKPFFSVFDPDDLPRFGRAGTRYPITKSRIWHIIHQRDNSCCACMGVGLMMLMREILGLRRIVLSQGSLYGQGNGGRDQGMAIDVCLHLLQTTGCCPVSMIGQHDWQGLRRGTWPANWKQKAKRYRIIRALDCPDRDAMNQANEFGYPVGFGSKGHAVFQIAPGLHVNSHGRSFGDDGVGQWATDREIDRDLPRYGAWVLMLSSDPIDDSDLPQPSKK